MAVLACINGLKDQRKSAGSGYKDIFNTLMLTCNAIYVRLNTLLVSLHVRI